MRIALFTCVAVHALCTLAPSQGWSFIGAVVGPAPRERAGLAFDEARGVTVMFGGFGSSSPLGDTWEWDGTTWTQRFSASSPPPRGIMDMAYDSVRGVTVLFGGSGATSQTLYDDTWEWDGNDWTQRFPATSPSARMSHRMAYSSVLGTTVLFGGTTSLAFGGPPPFADAWAWDGTNWTSLPGGPAARFDQAMITKPNGNIEMLGGAVIPVGVGDHWEWDGVSWTLIDAAIPPGPGPLDGAFMTGARSSMFVTGGLFGVGTWLLTNGTWVEDPRPETTTGLYGAFAYDSGRNRVVKFGGQEPPLFTTDQTWEYDPVGHAQFFEFGAGCAGASGAPSLSASTRPVLGTTFDVVLANIPATGSAWIAIGFDAGSPFPLDLTAIGATGCAMLSSHEVVTGFANPGGAAVLSLNLPLAATGLIGTSFYQQGFAVEVGANPLGLLASNGGEGVLGSF